MIILLKGNHIKMVRYYCDYIEKLLILLSYYISNQDVDQVSMLRLLDRESRRKAKIHFRGHLQVRELRGNSDLAVLREGFLVV